MFVGDEPVEDALKPRKDIVTTCRSSKAKMMNAAAKMHITAR